VGLARRRGGTDCDRRVGLSGWAQRAFPDQAASEAAAPVATWVTARVEFRVLSQTVISRGDVHAEVLTSVPLCSEVDAEFDRGVWPLGYR
jgi:hypothetical protein